MKKIKLTEATLRRIVERVVLEQKEEELQKQLQGLFKKKQDDPNCEDCDSNIAKLIKQLDMTNALTPDGKKGLTEHLK